jgi:hypothetical protein
MILKELQKIWYDSTTNTLTGKYSSKRLMGWGCFNLGMLNAIIRPELTELTITLLTAALGSAGLTMTGQFLNRKTADDNGQPLAPPPPCPPEHLNNAANE